jgi:hypothetical protein
MTFEKIVDAWVSSLDPNWSLDDAGEGRYVLVEQDPTYGHAWISRHASPVDAAEYVTQQDPSEWEPKALYDTRSKVQYEPKVTIVCTWVRA